MLFTKVYFCGKDDYEKKNIYNSIYSYSIFTYYDIVHR